MTSASRKENLHPRNSRDFRFTTLPSVSRSGGLSAEGDSLKDRFTQEDYWGYVLEKIHALESTLRVTSVPSYDVPSLSVGTDEGMNLLIMTRKLREGILASRRVDAFAVEVYETSLYLAAVLDSTSYTTSVSSHLISSLYSLSNSKTAESEHVDDRILAITLTLLHHLVQAPLSQTALFKELRILTQSSQISSTDSHCQWIADVARSLRSHNYIAFDKLSDYSRCCLSVPVSGARISLASIAMERTLNRLRAKARSCCTLVLRSSYVDFHASLETRKWLSRVVCLRSCRSGEQSEIADHLRKVDHFFDVLCDEGQMRRRGDVEPNRWVVNKKYGRS